MSRHGVDAWIIGPVTIVAAGLALVAAALFAVAAAAQQRAAAQVPDERARGLGLIRVLVRRPLWWVGTGGDLAGYAAQAAALGLGSLVLVQPLLVTTLLFALPLAAWWSGRRLSRADVGVGAGAVGRPRAVRGRRRADGGRRPGRACRGWLPAGVVLGVLLRGCLAGGGACAAGIVRAVLLAVATAVLYGAHRGADEGRGQPARRRRRSRWSPPGRRPR